MTDVPESRDNLVAFRISHELLARAEAVLEAVRRDPAARPHVGALVELILELTDDGLDYFFLEPLRRAEVSAITAAAARLGVAAAGRGIPTVVGRVVRSLDEDQVLTIADFVDEILIRPPDGG